MKVKEIIQKLKRNRADLDLMILKNPTNLPAHLVQSNKTMLEEQCPYKACQLFKSLNLANKENHFPENDISFEELLSILEMEEKKIDDLVEKSKSMSEEFFVFNKKLTIHQVIQIAIEQMLSAANFATFEIELDKLTKSLFK